jgi:glycosyltransferase involved in cell wall biosynthesis
MLIGHYAPRPGAPTGVADYAAALEHALSKMDSIRRNVAGNVRLYHIGNNPLHREIYNEALRVPGVALLHDAVLHHFMLGALSEPEYLGEFAWNYGEWRRDLACDLWRNRGASGSDPRYFRYPMLRRIVERSRAIVVHNPGAAEMARSASPLCPPVRVIPHLAEYHAPDVEAGIAFRQKIGASPGATLFGIFGYLREAKRICPSLSAFRRLHALRRDTALLLAGDIVSADLARLLEIEATHPAILRLGHLDERNFQSALSAIDCCINLRYPGAGETSGIAIRAMAAAKPVIVTDSPENSEYTQETCLRVAPGPSEAAELLDNMILISEFPALARQIGLAAQCHIREAHAPDRVAAMFHDALAAVAETRPIV